jgi:hypothetical protein
MSIRTTGLQVFILADDKLSSNKLFKSIGIDVNFVQSNASAQNDRMNKMYWERTEGKQSAPSPLPSQSHHVQHTQTFAASSQAVDLSGLRAELIAIVDQKIADLAAKMQDYANDTDGKINAIMQNLQNGRANHAPAQSHEAPAAKPREQLRDSGSVGKMNIQRQNEMDPADVSIQRMFNFSNSRDGKINR